MSAEEEEEIVEDREGEQIGLGDSRIQLELVREKKMFGRGGSCRT